ncbi:hypothetical protein AAE485_03445 [Acidithiobacillus ferriphilus]|uniref:hypothetical protein n=1 Tax=Acidithiobacillus ferriphilus TaxID=1689834 RepID=UPI00390C5D1B
MSGRIAILIDSGYFLKRLPKLVTPNRCDTPQNIVACIRQLCRTHVKRLTGKDDARWQQHLYRSFFYDAMPYEGKAHHPIDNRPIDYAKTEELLEYFRWARDEELDEIVVRERAHIEDEPADMAILLTYLCIDRRDALRVR